MMEAVSASETLADLYHAAWRSVPEDSRLRNSSRENLRSLQYKFLHRPDDGGSKNLHGAM
jgi:hypothetical protein